MENNVVDISESIEGMLAKLAFACAFMFSGLKVAGIINWSWVWVLSPLWIMLIIGIIAIISYFISMCLLGKKWFKN